MVKSEHQSPINKLFKEHWKLLLVLFVGIIQGAIYIRLVPPWQHYDEPGHVEFAWLISDRLRIPEQGDYDQSMRREMAASMIEYNFFNNLNFRPNLLSQNEPIWIGYSQISSQPLYYAFVALPLLFVRYADITFQLYLARIASLILYLVTIIAAYGIVREITPPEHPLRWMVPLTLPLLPGFVDLMTAVNDDVGATLAFSLFLWAGVRIILKGLSWLRVAALAITAIACAFTKATVVVAILLTSIPILTSLLTKVRKRYLWSGIAFLGLIILLSTVRLQDAAYWHRNTSQRLSTNAVKVESPIGGDSFQFNSSNGVFQLIDHVDMTELRGKTVTFGSWMWADAPTQLRTPSLRYDTSDIYQTVEVGRKPTFHAYSTTLPEDMTELLITVTPGGAADKEGRVYYDGIVLVIGDYSSAGVPTAKDIDASQLVWNRVPLKNYIRNASAERNWFVIRPIVDRLLEYYIPGSPNMYLSLLQDWQSSTWYYRAALKNLIQTFWGKFGWGHIPLLGRYSYYLLALFSLVGFGGCIVSMIRQRRIIPLNAYLFLFLSGLMIWLFAALRGLTSITEILLIPSARYAYPAIIPTVLAINMGWLEISQPLIKRGKSQLLTTVFVLLFVVLDIVAFASIILYFS
jgi:hypothetical protein